jgi:hypothetical protein
VAKARPRVTRRGIAYTPAHTRKYEAHGRLAAQLAMGDRVRWEVVPRGGIRSSGAYVVIHSCINATVKLHRSLYNSYASPFMYSGLHGNMGGDMGKDGEKREILAISMMVVR